MNRTSPLAPIGCNSTDVQETELSPFRIDDGKKREAWSETGQRLAEASLKVGTEVKNAAFDRERVKPVGT